MALFSIMVRRVHDAGLPGYAALECHPLVFRLPTTTEENPFKTQLEKPLQIIIILLDIAVLGGVLFLVFSAMPYPNYKMKAKVGGKSVYFDSVGYWNDKLVYKTYHSEKFFDGEKYIKNVCNYYISDDEKNLAYITEAEVKTDESKEGKSEKFNLFFNGELIDKAPEFSNFTFSNDSKHYLYIKKLAPIFDELCVDGKSLNLLDSERERKLKEKGLLSSLKIENAGFIGGKFFAELTIIDKTEKERVLLFDSERFTGITSDVKKSEVGKEFHCYGTEISSKICNVKNERLLFVTNDDSGKLFINVFSENERKQYAVNKNAYNLKSNQDFSHIAYLEPSKNETNTLFVDGKKVFESKQKVQGFGFTDDGENFAFYTDDDDSEKKILYLNGKKKR